MEDQKLATLAHYVETAIGAPNVVMWFVLPGGFVKGRPIGRKEYRARMQSNKMEIAELESGSPDRFFYLDDAVVVMGEGTKKLELGLIVLDGLQISAWGFAERDQRMAFKKL